MTDTPATSKRRLDVAALIIAAGLLVIAAVVAWDASRLGSGGQYARIGPQTIPYVIALCLAGLGAATVVAAFRRSFPERDEQEFAPVLWIVGGLLAQLVLIRFVGFSIATGILFGLTARGFGAKRLFVSIPAGIVLSTIVWVVFARGLSLSLPAGPLEHAITAALMALFSGSPA